MHVLAIDVGSSSVKMGILKDGRLLGSGARQSFPTRYNGNRAEVDSANVLRAIFRASSQLGAARRRVDVISLATMSPSWIAMDRNGKALTPIITHQDRRSAQIAIEIEETIGKERHLQITGNRPVPGGLSSTTCAWFLKNERGLMRRADLVGHVQTFLHRQFCGARLADPSHASFMGLYSTITRGGWNEEICRTVGLSKSILPEVRDAAEVGGTLLPEAARRLGMKPGTPMLVGMIDTGAAMLFAGAKVGQLVNVVGTTDVLALCTDNPVPLEGLLTRALGTGKRWVSVATIGAAGSSLSWANQQFLPELSEEQFFRLVDRLSRNTSARGSVSFDPYLAGDRCAVEQRQASFNGLTLSSTREQMLAAIVESLAHASAERLKLLKRTGTHMNRNVLISGGGGGALAKLMHRDWMGRWKFKVEEEATMRGLGILAKR